MNQISAAVVFQGPHQVGIGRLEMPPPRAGEIQIRTRYSGISGGTEGHVLAGRFTWTPARFPCVPGYQRIGVIEALGDGIQGWQLGQRVMATAGSWEGQVQPHWGAHVSLGNSPANEVYACPETASDGDLAHAVVAQVGLNAASRVSNIAGHWVLVYGDGLIGQAAAQCARLRGAKVILVGHRTDRLDLARLHSADAVINSHGEDVRTAVLNCTGGSPVFAVLDSVQGESVQREYMALLEPGLGQVVYCGNSAGTTWADMAVLQQRELTTHFVSGWTRARLEATLALMATGQLRIEALVTHRVSFERSAQMYEVNAQKSIPHLGMTLDWTGAN